MTHAAILSAWVGLRRGGLRGASMLGVLSAGMRPVTTQKSTVAGPTPTRLGAAVVPSASLPWQLAQFWAKSASPAGM